jgi:predicted enzyme related to lactoylglutathione lyase
MPDRTSHSPGTPSWTDLTTTDVDAAKRFYADLFGWAYDDQDAGGGMVYTICQRNGKAAAGLSKQPEMMAQSGAPPMWNTYVTVADVDASAGRVAGAGGQVMMQPMDVMDAGRMAVAADPTGAAFMFWQPKNNIGAEVVNEHGALSWNELQTPDVDAAAGFYSKLFGWKANPMDMGGMTYTVLELDGRSIGGAMKPPAEGVPAHWQVYFAVDDCDAAVATATKGDATVLAEPMDVPDVGRMAALMDPQGAAFSVIKNANPTD